MIKKPTFSVTKILLLFSVLFCAESNLYAQSINPNTLVFDRICAGGVANPTFSASFFYSDFPTGTTFQIELSDKTGSFTTGTKILSGVTTNDAPNKITITFSIPSDLVGSDLYSIRVKSSGGITSGPFFSSTSKKQFPIYYKLHEIQYTINNFVSTAIYCSGGSYLLSIDPVSSNPDSPLKYSTLSYNWYKDNGPNLPPTLMAGASGSSYNVSSPGTYYVETNYGSCSSTSYSNRVDVSSSASGSSVTVSSSLGNPFCDNGSKTVLTATSGGNSYVWKKDDVVITGATTRTYSTNEPAKYTVDVNFGGCTGSGNINLMSNSFDASIDVAETTTIQEGETLSVTVTDDASNPTYEWYLNGNLISGATTDTYLVAVRGNYKVKISQAGGCISSKEFSFKVNGDSGPSTVIPNIIKLSGNPYWNIPDEYKNQTTQVIIISSNGDKVLDVVNYQGDWPQTSIDIKNINPVYYYVIKGDTGEKKGSITVLK